MIPAGIAERVEAFLAQGMNLREQVAWSARDIVSTEESDHGRDAGGEGHRQRGEISSGSQPEHGAATDQQGLQPQGAG